jgi:hypothetical protein
MTIDGPTRNHIEALEASPQPSNTEALAKVVAEALEKDGVTVEWVRAVDHDIKPGVQSDMGPVTNGLPSGRRSCPARSSSLPRPPGSAGPRRSPNGVIERMDAMISETDDDGRPVA